MAPSHENLALGHRSVILHQTQPKHNGAMLVNWDYVLTHMTYRMQAVQMELPQTQFCSLCFLCVCFFFSPGWGQDSFWISFFQFIPAQCIPCKNKTNHHKLLEEEYMQLHKVVQKKFQQHTWLITLATPPPQISQGRASEAWPGLEDMAQFASPAAFCNIVDLHADLTTDAWFMFV